MRQHLIVTIAMFVIIGAGCTVHERPSPYPYPRVGSTARFQAYPRWDIGGTVTVEDERTLRFDGFTFNGGDLPAEIHLQRDDTKVAVLRDITGVPYDGASFTVTLPSGVSLGDFNLVTVYSPQFESPVSGATFSGT